MTFNSPAFRVGAIVEGVSTLIAYMSVNLSNDPSSLNRTRRAWFLIQDASGLVKRSHVRMAGINVGVIEDIKLEDGIARVNMKLRSDVPLTTSAKVEIRANGILGDKHIELIAGNPTDPPLMDGGQILNAEDRGSMDALLNEVGKITKSLGKVADSIQAATTGDGDTTQPLGRIVKNVEKLTGDLAELTSTRKQQVGEIIDNVHSITKTLDEYVNDDSPEGLKSAMRKATASLSRIDKTLTNVEEITGKINRGEGTLGKLVNDETTIDSINNTVDGINQMLDVWRKTQTSIDFNADYLANHGLNKSFFNIMIQPGEDRYYQLGIVDDPLGVVETVETTTGPKGGNESTVREQKRYYSRVKFNVLFAKNFANFTVKGGLMESTGGVGFEYGIWRRRLTLALDFFRLNNVNMRATARFKIFSGLFISGGAEDILGREQYSTFVGAGLFLTNDDLKSLLTSVPRMF